MSILKEVVEYIIEDPRGRLARSSSNTNVFFCVVTVNSEHMKPKSCS